MAHEVRAETDRADQCTGYERDRQLEAAASRLWGERGRAPGRGRLFREVGWCSASGRGRLFREARSCSEHGCKGLRVLLGGGGIGGAALSVPRKECRLELACGLEAAVGFARHRPLDQYLEVAVEGWHELGEWLGALEHDLEQELVE